MDVAYSTNAWGKVTTHCCGSNNVNYAYYVATGSDEDAVRGIAKAGYESVEMFDGNLLAYEDDPGRLQILLERCQVSLKAVYSAANFIYDEILEEEYAKIMRTARLARKLGARHLVLGGGAVRCRGIRESDYEKLGKALDGISDRAGEIGLITSFHPHMGSLVESPEQLDKVMEHTKVWLCPDCGHVALGGGNPYDVAKKYIGRIQYFHLKGVDEKGRFCSLDKGLIDFKPILGLLQESDKKIELAVECDAESKAPEEDAGKTAIFLKDCGVK